MYIKREEPVTETKVVELKPGKTTIEFDDDELDKLASLLGTGLAKEYLPKEADLFLSDFYDRINQVRSWRDRIHYSVVSSEGELVTAFYLKKRS